MAFSDQLFETRETLPGSRTVTYTYKNTGELATVDGAETYKQSYDYDSQGRMSTLSTYKTPTVPQNTTWAYNNRGFMTSKTYADGKGTTYTYTDDGELATRVWDRGITTTYSYDNAGRQTGVDYSDSTPDITYTYDWMGNPATVTDAEGTRTFTYNYTTSGHPGLASVTVPGIVASIDYTYDAYGRRTAMSLMKNSSAVLTNNYGYDTTSGKLNKIDDGTYSANYTYADGTGLITQNQIKLESTSVVVTTHNRTYDTRLNNYHLLNTSNTTGATTRTYSYLYNDKDQRTKLTLPDGSYWEYSYDDKGQVTGGIKKDASGNLIAGQYFGYSYDGIGNRLYAETKLAALKLTYTTNNVNQYTQINTPGIVPVLGEADADTTVQAVRTDASNLTGGKQKTIPTRSGKYFSGAFTDIDNSTAAQTITYDVYAIKDETTTQQIQKASSSYTVPKAVTSPTYDTDGNMTSDGEWTYTWNGENRKIAAEKSDMKLEFVYDYMGRRVSKKVYTGSTGNWTLSTHQKFVYNGYKQIAEFDGMNNDAVQKKYTWQPVDLDVPLWVKDGTNYYFYIVDGNKNIRAMVDASGTLVAQYDYNPFGKVVASSGSYKGTNKYRFSSEYHDNETGLVYYNYRYYDADFGRWTKRDPIGELGGVNPYVMASNNTIKYWDNLGLEVNEAAIITFARFISNVRKWEEEYDKINPGKCCLEKLEAFQKKIHDSAIFTSSGSFNKNGEHKKERDPKTKELGWHYFYTKDQGWVDLGHFSNAAYYTHWGRGVALGWYAPVSFLVKTGGYAVELGQFATAHIPGFPAASKTSAFTREDFRSNRLGAEFPAFLADIEDCRSLTDALKKYFDQYHPSTDYPKGVFTIPENQSALDSGSYWSHLGRAYGNLFTNPDVLTVIYPAIIQKSKSNNDAVNIIPPPMDFPGGINP